MKKKMGKRIRSAIILAALLVAGGVCIPPKEVMFTTPLMTLEEGSGGLTAMEVENIDEQGKVFAYGEEIQLQVKVALWVFEHEDYDFSSLIAGNKLTVV